jgi:hypothetical protein
MDSLMNPEVKKELEEFVSSLALPPKVYGQIALKVYAQAVSATPAVMEPQGSLQQRQELLDATRYFLNLGDDEFEAVGKLHTASGAPLFDKALKEALEAGQGVVSEQFKEGLAKLGELLMMSQTDQQEKLLEAVKRVMKPKVDRMVDAFERKVRGAKSDRLSDCHHHHHHHHHHPSPPHHPHHHHYPPRRHPQPPHHHSHHSHHHLHYHNHLHYHHQVLSKEEYAKRHPNKDEVLIRRNESMSRHTPVHRSVCHLPTLSHFSTHPTTPSLSNLVVTSPKSTN